MNDKVYSIIMYIVAAVEVVVVVYTEIVSTKHCLCFSGDYAYALPEAHIHPKNVKKLLR